MERMSNLVVNSYRYLDQIPFYQGNLNGKGFPIILSRDQVPESAIWICAVAGRIGAEESAAVLRGDMGQSVPHIHKKDMVYLLLGEEGAVSAEISLAGSKYEVSAPASVFIPAGMPHGIRPLRAKEGAFGGVCAIYYHGEYDAQPVPAGYRAAEDTARLVVQGYHWSESLSSHKGSVGGKGFPILLSSALVEEANTWICPAMPPHTPEMCHAINSGAGYAGATLHYHDTGDELYLILGDSGAITIRVSLNGEVFDLQPPAAVYMPAGVVHTLDPVQAEVGKFGGPCAIFAGREYTTVPVE